MNVHFIYLNMNNENPAGDIHFGLASLSAVLKGEGHGVSLSHLRFGDRAKFEEKTVADIKRRDPDIIGFSLTELEEYSFRKLSSLLKDEFDIPVIAGGSFPSIAPEEVITSPGVDMVVRGEAENVLPKLLDAMEKKKPIGELRGVWSKDNGKVFRNDADLPPDIAELPPMDFSIFDDGTVVGGKFDGLPKLGYLCNRGCPFRCTYCINDRLRRLYPKGSHYTRFQNVDKVMEDLAILKERYRFGIINFYDDTLLMNRKWMEDFSRKYRKAIDIPFICNARPENCTRSLISMTANAGCRCLLIGIETGNQRLRMKVLNRKVTDSQIFSAFKLADEFRIRTYTYNMIGIPYETEKDILETIRMNAKVRPFSGGISAFYPFKGTELGDLCYRMGWVLENKKGAVRSFIEGSIVEYPQLSNRMIEWYLRNFDLLLSSKVDGRQFLRLGFGRLLKHYRVFGRLQLRKKLRGTDEMYAQEKK